MQVETDRRAGREDFRTRMGGIDTPSALMGMFAALGVLVFLGALLGAGAGSIPFQLNALDLEGNAVELAAMGILVAALVVFVSFLLGGWAAGRMARFDGGINGVASALWALLLIAIFAGLGAWVGAEYNAFQRVGLPDWFSQFRGDDVTTLGVVAAIAGIGAMFIGGYVGGEWGERFHGRVDSALDRSGAIDDTTSHAP